MTEPIQQDISDLKELTDELRQSVIALAEGLADGGKPPTIGRLYGARKHVELALRDISGEGQRDGEARGLRLATDSEGSRWNQKTAGGGEAWVQRSVQDHHRVLTAALGASASSGPSIPLAPMRVSEPAMQGTTEFIAVPDLVSLLQSQWKTGTLRVQTPVERFELEFQSGSLLHASSSASPEGQRLGDILVRRGAITREELDERLAAKSSAERMGDLLVRGELVPQDELTAALDEQVQHIFHRVFSLPKSRFEFREGLAGEASDRVRYNVTRLLLESARHCDEQNKRSAG